MSSNAIFGKTVSILAIALALERCANSVRALFSVVGSYVNVFSGTIALAVVVYTVLYRAIDALDMLFASLGFVHHDQILSKSINSNSPSLAKAGKRVCLGIEPTTILCTAICGFIPTS